MGCPSTDSEYQLYCVSQYILCCQDKTSSTDIATVSPTIHCTLHYRLSKAKEVLISEWRFDMCWLNLYSIMILCAWTYLHCFFTMSQLYLSWPFKLTHSHLLPTLCWWHHTCAQTFCDVSSTAPQRTIIRQVSLTTGDTVWRRFTMILTITITLRMTRSSREWDYSSRFKWHVEPEYFLILFCKGFILTLADVIVERQAKTVFVGFMFEIHFMMSLL